MLGNQKISQQQCTVLIMMFTIGTSILVIPSSLAGIAKQDGWIAPILGIGIGLIIINLYYKIGVTFPAMNLMEINEWVFGKWLGKFVSLCFTFVGLHNSAQVLFYLGNFLTTQILPDTPIQVINILFMAIIVMGIRLGLENLARAAEIFLPWILILFLIFLLSVSPQSKLENIQPILEKGIRPILNATLTYLSYSCLPLVVFLVFFPKSLNAPQQMKKSFYHGFIGGSIAMAILTLVTLLVLGPALTARLSYSAYALAKGINIADFLQRIEAIIAGMWFITLFYKLTFYFFASIGSFAQTLQLKDYRTVVYPFAVIVVVLSLIVYPNTAYMGDWDSHIWVPYILSIGLFYPLLLLVIGKCKQYFAKKRKSPLKRS